MAGDALGQTITVVNKSGKVVSTSKHIVNVFKEARAAYRERKAEIQAQRDGEPDKPRPAKLTEGPPSESRSSHNTKHLKDSSKAPAKEGRDFHRSSSSRDLPSRRASAQEDSYRKSSHAIHRKPVPRRPRPSTERGYSDGFYDGHKPRRSRTDIPKSSPLRFMEEAENETRGKELVRRRSFADVESMRSRSARQREDRDSGVDMDLAYGELPPSMPVRRVEEETELKVKVTTLNRILEEAQCLQHSAHTTIKMLEKNPDAMAAVGLTLAEISGLVTKLGPGALAGLKATFPAVVALLVSPEFLIAVGVGVGVTVIAFGSYKIVKRIKAKKEAEKAEKAAEAGHGQADVEEVESDVDLNSIESWRRGVADVENASVGTSVDGEIITPGAAAAKKEEERETRKRREKEAKKAKETKAKEEKAEKAEKKKKQHEREAAAKEEKKAKKDKDARDKKKAEDDLLL